MAASNQTLLQSLFIEQIISISAPDPQNYFSFTGSGSLAQQHCFEAKDDICKILYRSGTGTYLIRQLEPRAVAEPGIQKFEADQERLDSAILVVQYLCVLKKPHFIFLVTLSARSVNPELLTYITNVQNISVRSISMK